MHLQPSVAHVARELHAFALVKEDGTVTSFDPTRLVHVAGWLRHAGLMACQRLALEATFADHFVAGHQDANHSGTRRFSYVPLPSIGTGNEDGRIRRALIVEPAGERHPLAQQMVEAYSDAKLIDKYGRVRAVLRPVSSSDLGSATAKYVMASQTWGSVTPVLLPGRDDRQIPKAVKLVHKALAQSQMRALVTDIHVQKDPIFPGTATADAYTKVDHLLECPRWHVMVTFSEMVQGPILIGSGRHYGLGLLAGL